MKTLQILTEINDFLKSKDINTITNLKLKLEEQIRKESISKPLAKKDKLIAKLLKNIKIYSHERLYGFTNYNNKFIFSDDRRAYITENNFGYDKVQNPMDFNRILPTFQPRYEIKIDVNDLKYHINQNKANKINVNNKKFTYRLHCEEGRFDIGFNPIFLEEILQMYDTDVIFVEKPNSFCLVGDFHSGLFGILLCIRDEND